MKHLFVILFCLLAHIAYAQDDKSLVKVGDAVPAFVISHDDGTQIVSSSYKGKVVLINFFATWCPPCQKELAEVKNTLWPKYKLKTYNKKKGFEFPLYPDKDRSIYSAFAESLIPRSYLIDKQGKIIFAGSGFNEDDFKALMGKIENALKD